MKSINTKSGVFIAIGAVIVSTIGCCGILGLVGVLKEPPKVAQTNSATNTPSPQKSEIELIV